MTVHLALLPCLDIQPFYGWHCESSEAGFFTQTAADPLSLARRGDCFPVSDKGGESTEPSVGTVLWEVVMTRS